MTIEPENVTAFCTGARPEMEAAAAEIWNSTAPTSPETLHGDQMGAFAHSVRARSGMHALARLAQGSGWCGGEGVRPWAAQRPRCSTRSRVSKAGTFACIVIGVMFITA